MSRRADNARVPGPLLLGLTGLLLVALAPLSSRGAPGPGDPPAVLSFLRSPDGGVSFSPMALNDRTPEGEWTRLVAGPGDVHAVYSDRDPQPRSVFYRRSRDAGRSFGASVRLDLAAVPGAEEVGDSGEPDLAVAGPAAHVVWEDDPVLGEPFVLAAPGARLTDDLRLGDGSFLDAEDGGKEDRADNDVVEDNFVLPPGFVFPAGSLDPRTSGDLLFDDPATDGVDFTVEPEDRDDVFYSRSGDGGDGFSLPLNLSASAGDHNRDPKVAADGDHVAIVYESLEDPESENDEVLFGESTDGGRTWSAINVNVTGLPDEQDEPALAVTGGSVTVVFRDGDRGRVGVVHAGSPGGGFSRPKPLAGKVPATAEHSSPAMWASGPAVVVVACQNVDPTVDQDGDERFKLLRWRSGDGGASFGSPLTVDSGAGSCNKPAVSGAGRTAQIVYEREAPGLDGIVGASSADGGATFGPPRSLSSGAVKSEHPSVAVDPADPKSVYVGWSDSNDLLLVLGQGQSLPDSGGSAQAYEDEDVVRATGAVFEMVFDGSDVGLEALAVDGLARLAHDELLLSFRGGGEVAGLGHVDGSDIVSFKATSLGSTTAGTFTLWLDGAQIGLDTPEEDLDALEVRGNELFISTAGPYAVPGAEGSGADIVTCRLKPAGEGGGCGPFTRPFRGAAAGLGAAGEEVDAFAFDTVDPAPVTDPDSGEAQVEETRSVFSFAGSWKGRSAAGGPGDVAACAYPEATAPADGPPPRPSGLADCGRAGAVPLLLNFVAAERGLAVDVAALELDY